MSAYRTSAALAASLAFAAPALAQTGTQGTASGGGDVNASTCGSGSTTGTSITVQGCADANAANGGTVDTSNTARANERMGMQRSTARAVDADERARARTQTQVRQGGVVRSRTMTMYHKRGEKPVHEVITNTSPKPSTKPH
ncbi:MAG: hypothetical protein E6G94_11725 [Alphaproteobacteria bacterium]|nr:MAG: hypothetical protein E6G94_11725 [Alphaproteobacteria bacterium]